MTQVQTGKLQGKGKIASQEVNREVPLYTAVNTQRLIGEARRKRHFENRKRLVGIAETLAEDKTFHSNWKYDEAEQAFPGQSPYWYVEKMFPYAKDGMLLVDEPMTPEEEIICETKAKFLRSHGYRYLIVKQGMTMDDAFMQIFSRADADSAAAEAGEDDFAPAIVDENSQAPQPSGKPVRKGRKKKAAK